MREKELTIITGVNTNVPCSRFVVTLSLCEFTSNSSRLSLCRSRFFFSACGMFTHVRPCGRRKCVSRTVEKSKKEEHSWAHTCCTRCAPQCVTRPSPLPYYREIIYRSSRARLTSTRCSSFSLSSRACQRERTESRCDYYLASSPRSRETGRR